MSTVTPHDFITIADELINDSCSIKIRTAVGRGYYGAFHAAKEFHDQLPTPGTLQADRDGGGMHEQLIQRLENPTLGRTHALWLRSKSVGTMLRRVRGERTHADYHLTKPYNKEQAEDALEKAKTIIAKSLPSPAIE